MYIESTNNPGNQNPHLEILRIRYFQLGDISKRLAVINVKLLLVLVVDINLEKYWDISTAYATRKGITRLCSLIN